MLKKWLNKVLSGRQSRQTEVRKEIIPAEEYRISADMISFAAEKPSNVCKRKDSKPIS